MTRILKIETCEQCPYAVGSRGCGHEDVLWSDGVVSGRARPFDDYFVIPDWCPLEQVAPDWRPPRSRSEEGGDVK